MKRISLMLLVDTFSALGYESLVFVPKSRTKSFGKRCLSIIRFVPKIQSIVIKLLSVVLLKVGSCKSVPVVGRRFSSHTTPEELSSMLARRVLCKSKCQLVMILAIVVMMRRKMSL